MASRMTKFPSSRKKKFHLSNTDLARAAVAPANQRRSIIKQATGGDGYDRYKGIRACLGAILNVELPLVPSAAPATVAHIKKAIARACNRGPGEVESNQGAALGLYEYIREHKVLAADFDLGPVNLGRAGRRQFWAPYILKISDKNYVPYFDFRGDTRLLSEARRFVFSINHTFIRLFDEEQYGDFGFVIFQFEELNAEGVRKAIPHFDNDLVFWNDKELGAMIDEVYRVLDEIRKAA
jgi:hypothetical protein